MKRLQSDFEGYSTKISIRHVKGLVGIFLERSWKAGSYTNLEIGKQFN